MIPKVIHYCWFGRHSLPEDAKKCINSWKKYCPEYEIVEWNEDNFDINCCQYVKEAYKAKKWAFVSDYARFWILYKYGGLYFDTDVEIIKSFDEIIQNGPFMGIEVGEDVLVAPGLGIGAEANNEIYKKILLYYESQTFETDGNIDTTTVVKRVTEVLKSEGYKGTGEIEKVGNIVIYPTDYFCPMDYENRVINITENTFSIHHYSSSWMPEEEVKAHINRIKYKEKYGEKKGLRIAKLVNFPIRLKYHIKDKGIWGTIKFALKK